MSEAASDGGEAADEQQAQRDGYTGGGRAVSVLIGAARPAYCKTMTSEDALSPWST